MGIETPEWRYSWDTMVCSIYSMYSMKIVNTANLLCKVPMVHVVCIICVYILYIYCMMRKSQFQVRYGMFIILYELSYPFSM